MMHATAVESQRDTLDSLVLGLGYGGYSFGLIWGAEPLIAGAAHFYGGNLGQVVPAYLAAGMVSGDPVVRRVRKADGPVMWAPYMAETKPRGEGCRMREIAALLGAHDIVAGVTIPFDVDAAACRGALAISAPGGMSPEEFEARFVESGWVLRLAALVLGSLLGRSMTRQIARSLSSSERLVLEHLAEGLRPRDIAERLGKSEHTVRNQIVSAQQRLGARTKEQAVAMALRFRLIES